MRQAGAERHRGDAAVHPAGAFGAHDLSYGGWDAGVMVEVARAAVN